MNSRPAGFPNYFVNPQLNPPIMRQIPAGAAVFVTSPQALHPRPQILMGVVSHHRGPSMQSFIQPVQFRSQISNLPPLNPQTHPPTMVPSGFAGPNQFQNGFESGQRLISVSQPAYSNFSPSRPQFFGQNVQPNSIAPVRHQQVQQNPPLMTPVNQRLTEREFNRDLSPWSVRQISPAYPNDQPASEFHTQRPFALDNSVSSEPRKLTSLMDVVIRPPHIDNFAEKPWHHTDPSTSVIAPLKRPHSDEANNFGPTKMLKLSPGRPSTAAYRPVVIKTPIEELLDQPGREKRPEKLVVIFRGVPGSGKSFTAKLIKEREVENGGVGPRILCFDDYFMTDEEEETTSKPGRKSTEKVLSYEYDPAMEPSYRKQFVKSFKKTIDGGFFNFIIVDSIHQKLNHFDEIWCYARQNGYQVYVVECHADSQTCAARNIHKRKLHEIESMSKSWEETPSHFIQLDCSSLFNKPEEDIEEVDMDLQGSEQLELDQEDRNFADSGSPIEQQRVSQSKWELLDTTEVKLDKLDGLKKLRKHADTPDELLSYEMESNNFNSQPGKKRVRWADVEEHKDMEKQKAMGFVVGVTDWRKITGEYDPGEALAKTKFI